MAELTSEQLVDRWNDEIFQKKITAAVLKLVRWIRFENAGTPNHEMRDKWRMVAQANPAQQARVISAMVVTDIACNQDTMPGDAEVYSAVETLVNVYTE